MKSLWLFLLVFAASEISFAAKWQPLAPEESVFAPFIESTGYYADVYTLVSKKKTEPLINSLKQLTFIIRAEAGEYSIPDKVTIVADGHLVSVDLSYGENHATWLKTIRGYASDSVFKSFEGYDGNSFGDCGNIYLFDQKNKQVAVFSACYGE